MHAESSSRWPATEAQWAVLSAIVGCAVGIWTALHDLGEVPGSGEWWATVPWLVLAGYLAFAGRTPLRRVFAATLLVIAAIAFVPLGRYTADVLERADMDPYAGAYVVAVSVTVAVQGLVLWGSWGAARRSGRRWLWTAPLAVLIPVLVRWGNQALGERVLSGDADSALRAFQLWLSVTMTLSLAAAVLIAWAVDGAATPEAAAGSVTVPRKKSG